MTNLKAEDLELVWTYEYEGVYLPKDVLQTTVDDLKTFDIRQDDVFLVTFPKAGTSWTQEIMSAILHDGDIETLNKTPSWKRGHFLEITFGGHQHRDRPKTHKEVADLPTSSPRLLKCHLPGQLLPPQVWEKKIRMVYVIRNPKDVLVSYFHHLRLFAPHEDLQFEKVFSMFMDGTIPYGKWWEHYLYFWQRRDEDYILFLRFEDMKKDLRGTVKRISEFLGKSLSDEILDAITDHCSFENMKKNPMTNPDTFLRGLLKDNKIPEGQSFLRKGIVGDWKAHLSEAQSKALDELFEEKLAGTGLSFD